MRTALFALSLAALPLFGCGGDDDGDGMMAPADPEPEAPPAGDTYVAGLEKMGVEGVLKARLVDALPAPPALGDNTWVLEVLDMDDSPIEGCTVSLDPRMPAHGHGTNTAAEISEMGAGRYEATPVDLFMPGLWVTAVQIDCGEMSDRMVYEFWIEG